MLRAILRGLLDLMAPARCPGCDARRDWGHEGFCGVCGPLLEPLSSGPALYGYGGPLAEAIRGLKYRGRLDYLPPLAALLAEGARSHFGKVEVVVPVPMHPERLRRRGVNPPELLAEPLARALGVPLVPEHLVRVRDTVPQASLAEAEREANVRGAFEGRAVPGRVLLVDDVRTTGATLRSAAGALHRAGARHVRVLALAGVVAR